MTYARVGICKQNYKINTNTASNKIKTEKNIQMSKVIKKNIYNIISSIKFFQLFEKTMHRVYKLHYARQALLFTAHKMSIYIGNMSNM